MQITFNAQVKIALVTNEISIITSIAIDCHGYLQHAQESYTYFKVITQWLLIQAYISLSSLAYIMLYIILHHIKGFHVFYSQTRCSFDGNLANS